MPPSRLRARKRRRRAVVAGVAVSAAVLLCVGLVALAHAPFIQVTSVQVAGTASVATGTVEARVSAELAGS